MTGNGRSGMEIFDREKHKSILNVLLFAHFGIMPTNPLRTELLKEADYSKQPFENINAFKEKHRLIRSDTRSPSFAGGGNLAAQKNMPIGISDQWTAIEMLI